MRRIKGWNDCCSDCWMQLKHLHQMARQERAAREEAEATLQLLQLFQEDAAEGDMDPAGMGAEPFNGAPDAAQPDMEVPPADVIMLAHTDPLDMLMGRIGSASAARKVHHDSRLCNIIGMCGCRVLVAHQQAFPYWPSYDCAYIILWMAAWSTKCCSLQV